MSYRQFLLMLPGRLFFWLQVSAQTLAAEAAGLIEDETYWEAGKSFKLLWERFLTAINSVGPTSAIVVKNHSHLELSSA
jgi:hypothetical protein